MRNTVTIYVPDDLRARLAELAPRTMSRICQDALRAEVDRREALRDQVIADAFEED